MTEIHYAYKVEISSDGIESKSSGFQSNKMLHLLTQIQKEPKQGLYWVLKQFENHPKEHLCLVDSGADRIYYHYSGEVESLSEAIARLSK
jgi:hypothetical protein